MPFAPTSGARFGYVAEAEFGVTPATPTFLPIRATGAGLRTNKTTVTSDEIRADRNISDEAQTGQDVTGSYAFELSYGSFDDFLAAALFSDWNADVLVNGVTPKSFTVEETLRVGGVQNSFARFDGVMVNSLSLSIASRAKVTGSFEMMGRKETLAATPIVDATYTDPSTEPVLTASAHVMNLAVAGVADVRVRSLNLQISNNLRTRPAVGDLYSAEFGAGSVDVTGTVEAYFASNALYQKVLDHGSGALSLTVGATAGKRYSIELPRSIFLNGERRVGGKDDDVMVSIPIRGVYDSSIDGSIRFTRAVA